MATIQGYTFVNEMKTKRDYETRFRDSILRQKQLREYEKSLSVLQKNMENAMLFDSGIISAKPGDVFIGDRNPEGYIHRGVDWAEGHGPNAAMIKRDNVYSSRKAHAEAVVADKRFKAVKKEVKSIPAACLRQPVENGLVLRYNFPVINS